MTTFDKVLPGLVRICEQDSNPLSVSKYCVVRDVRGRVRLAVQTGGAASSLSGLTTRLENSLGGYFVGPVLSSDGHDEERRLVARLFEHANARWPQGWPDSYADLLGNETPLDVTSKWSGIERTIGKESWLTATSAGSPWPLVPGKTPPIITFHSFKGGVGRTTLLATYAIHLAVRGKRVAVVDLDLEAPGVGSLLGVSLSERGVIDVLVDHIATSEIDLSGVLQQVSLGTNSREQITVLSAGKQDRTYIQKLARLDFSSGIHHGSNPVGEALTAMLKHIKTDFDAILLDSRAGLHDLAGMSLHGLAHANVLVFRGTKQGLMGLEQTIETLDLQNQKTDLVLVETMLPQDEDVFQKRHQTTRERAYDYLVKHWYPEIDPPQQSDVGEPHDVLAVRRKEWIDALDAFEDAQLHNLRTDLDFQSVARRIDEVCELAIDDGDAEGDETK